MELKFPLVLSSAAEYFLQILSSCFFFFFIIGFLTFEAGVSFINTVISICIPIFNSHLKACLGKKNSAESSYLPCLVCCSLAKLKNTSTALVT